MSISSLEGSPLPADLAAKYEKLATEYAKLRAQNAVLKKAVVEEQTKSAELRDELKTKDQIVRKHEQEFDSITFRNQQLTKRITVLQSELDHLQSLGKKARQSKIDGNSARDNIVMQEELEKKLNENVMLISQLEAFEADKLIWQEEVAAYKQMVRNSQKVESECECERLRCSLAAVESALEASRLQNSSDIAKKLVSSERFRTIVQNLPIMNILNGIFSLASACAKLAPSLVFKDEAFGSGDSSNQVLQCLISYHSSLESVIAAITESNAQAMLRSLSSLLSDLERALVCCFNTDVNHSKAEEALISLGEVAKSLRSTSQYHLGVLKKVWDGHASQLPYDLIVQKLTSVFTSSCALWKYASESLNSITSTDTNETLSSMIDLPGREPCEDCKKNSLCYEQKISALEEKIRHMTATAESLQGVTKQRNLKSENGIDPIHVDNEFGHGVLPTDVGWPEATVRELILKNTSQAIEDRQCAESKLSRFATERDAAYSRMLIFEEQCKEQNDLITNLQEELTIIKCNYEEQLGSMTEHVANMNDKLAAQQTEIEGLTYELMSKDNKKGRHK